MQSKTKKILLGISLLILFTILFVLIVKEKKSFTLHFPHRTNFPFTPPLPQKEEQIREEIGYSQLKEVFDPSLKVQAFQKVIISKKEVLPDEYKVFSVISRKECSTFDDFFLLFPIKLTFFRGNLYVSVSTRECVQGEIKKVVGYILFNNQLIDQLELQTLTEQFPQKKWLGIWNPQRITSLGVYSIVLEIKNQNDEIVDKIEGSFEIIGE